MDIKKERVGECICCSLPKSELLLDIKSQIINISENESISGLMAYQEFISVPDSQLSEITRNGSPELCQICLTQLEFAYKYFRQCREAICKLEDSTCCRSCSYVQFSGDNMLCDMRITTFDFNSVLVKYIDVFLEYSNGVENLNEPYKICKACIIQAHNSYVFRAFCRHACKILKQKYEVLKNKILNFEPLTSETTNSVIIKEENDNWEVNGELALLEPLEIKMIQNDNHLDFQDFRKKFKKKKKHKRSYSPDITLETEENDKEKRIPFYRIKLAGHCYECAHCGGKYKNITYLREHILWKHLPKSSEPQSYLCSECGETFELARHLAHHKLKVHCKTRYKCTVCEQVYKYSSDLKKHMFKHSGGRVGFVKCPHCSKMLKSEESVAKHIKATHDKFKCDVCNKNFPCHYTMFQHKFDHLGYLPYNCPELNEEGVICNYKSKVKDHFRLHLHKVHSLRYDETIHGYTEAKAEMLKKITEEKLNAHAHKTEQTHKCDKCSSSFQTYTGLYHHKQRAHLQVSFDCKFCDKKFTQKPSLWTHSFLHRDFYPFNCSLCSYTVRNKKSMQLHLKRVHDILYSESVHGFKRETFDQVIDFVLKKSEVSSNDVSLASDNHNSLESSNINQYLELQQL